MLLLNRIIAREGPRVKDGLLQHYDFSKVEYEEKWLTLHRHPANNHIASNVIIGRFFNEKLVDGILSADMDIFDDLLSDEELQSIKGDVDVSIGYWYEVGKDDNIAHPIRKVKTINHVAIGVEKGVCSYPECGLSVAAADDKDTSLNHGIFDTDTFEDEKMPNNTQTQLNVGCDEKDATIEKLTKELKETQETLKVAQDSLTVFESEEKRKLTESLAKRLKVDADSFKDRTLDDLKKLDQDTAHLSEPVGLVLKKKATLEEASDEDENSFKLTESGELPLTSHESDNDFYKGANKK